MGIDQSASTRTFDTLALLALPDFNSLSEQQVRGVACVWDSIVLTSATAIDLGPREVKRLGEKRLWYPRACRRCTATQALRALYGHVADCLLCRSESSMNECDTGHGLRRVIRDSHRGAIALDQLSAVVLPCEPCMHGRLFGGEHNCTGAAARPTAGGCPCCSPRADR